LIKTNGERTNSPSNLFNTESFVHVTTSHGTSEKLSFFSVESCDNLSYVPYEVVTQDGLGLCVPSLNDLQYIIMQLHTTKVTPQKTKTPTP
jgi:hypothetical protein